METPDITDVFLVSVKKLYTLFWCFHGWTWTSKWSVVLLILKLKLSNVTDWVLNILNNFSFEAFFVNLINANVWALLKTPKRKLGFLSTTKPVKTNQCDCIFLTLTVIYLCVKSVRIRSYSGPYFSCIFPHSEWIRRDMEIRSSSPYSVRMRENGEKCRPE